jgi:hypothetical protein
MRTVETIVEEITNLNGQDDAEAFKKFYEIAGIGRDSGNNFLLIMGLLNAASLACKMGDYELCMQIINDASGFDEEICTKYLGEPHMEEMISTLGRSGYLEK